MARLSAACTSSTLRADCSIRKRAEHEPDRREAKRPLGELPGDDGAQPPRRSADDGECLSDTLSELGNVGSDPHAEGDGADDDDDERDRGDGLVPEEPREVEARQVRQHVEARQDALRHRPGEERDHAERIDDRQHELELTRVV